MIYKRTESELDIARLESRARAVDSEFASERGEVLDKVVQHVLHGARLERGTVRADRGVQGTQAGRRLVVRR